MRRPSQIAALTLCFTVSQVLPAFAQSEVTTGQKTAVEESQEPREDAAPPSSRPKERAEKNAIAVRITLNDTTLTEEQIVVALQEEFGLKVVIAPGAGGLRIVVDKQQLQASYRDEAGKVIERNLQLPRDPARQVETIALLSGNLARDEAGELLEQLRAETIQTGDSEGGSDLPPAPVPPPVEPMAETDEDNDDENELEAPPTEPPPPEDKPEDKAAPVEGTNDEAPPPPSLPLAATSFSLAGQASYPRDLHRKLTNFHLGAIYSDIGSVDGFAGALIALRNRGAGAQGAGQGAQVSALWIGSDGFFTGFSGAGIAATERGGIEGVQAAGVFTFQKNETKGAQLAGVGSVSMSNIDGVQLAGAGVATWGDIEGVQAAGAAAVLHGNLEGVQAAGALALTTGDVEGFQLGTLTFAHEVDGTQLGVANIAHGGLTGFQIGVGNYSGDVHGTQIGLLNIGGNVRGAQIGLVNVAKDVDGIAFAPVNIIPGIRNQVVTYGSWAPVTSHEGAPAGPLIHLGVKFMPEPFYTQFSMGLGAEAEECPSGLLPGDAGCTGNGVIYAPAFAVGLRGVIVAGLFSEFDLQYQFEKAFSASQAQRHAVLGRAALGYDFDEKIGLFGGGGPRMDVRVSADGTVDPLVTWSPHVFAGIQAF